MCITSARTVEYASATREEYASSHLQERTERAEGQERRWQKIRRGGGWFSAADAGGAAGHLLPQPLHVQEPSHALNVD